MTRAWLAELQLRQECLFHGEVQQRTNFLPLDKRVSWVSWIGGRLFWIGLVYRYSIHRHGLNESLCQCPSVCLTLLPSHFLTPFPSYFNSSTFQTKFVMNVSSSFSSATHVTAKRLALSESLISPSNVSAGCVLVNWYSLLLVLFFAVHFFQLPRSLLEFLFCNEGSWLLEASQNLWPVSYIIYLITRKKTNKRTFWNIPRDFPHWI